MENTTEKLLKSFTEICEDLISNSYVVTNGRAVLSTVLDHSLADQLCKLAIKKYESQDWKVATIENAVELAYRTGYNDAIRNIEKIGSDETSEEGK